MSDFLNPVFIGGTGRSGTSILKRVLARHPDVVAIPGELRLIIDPGGCLPLLDAVTRDWSPYAVDAAVGNFTTMVENAGKVSGLARGLRRVLVQLGASSQKYSGMQLAKTFGKEFYSRRLAQLLDELGVQSTPGAWIGSRSFQLKSVMWDCAPLERDVALGVIRNYFNDLYAQIKRDPSQSHWVEDTPFNILHATRLLELFPNMRLIHIYRDPRDVLVSYRTKKWGGQDILRIAARLNNIYARWDQQKANLPDDRFLEVALNHLVQHPHETITKILEFAVLPVPGQLESMTGLVSQKNAHLNRWKNDLSPEEIALVESALTQNESRFE